MSGRAHLHSVGVTFRFTNLLNNQPMIIVPRRFRYKKKWAFNKKPTGPRQLALDNFDAFYKPVYGDRWPVTRLSLLSVPKYCAVVNNFSDPITVIDKLHNIGAEDFIMKARTKQISLLRAVRDLEQRDDIINPSNYQINSKLGEVEIQQKSSKDSDDTLDISKEPINSLDPEMESMYDEYYNDNVDVFVPTVKVRSAKDELIREEIKVNTFEPRDVEVNVQHGISPTISKDVSAAIFPPGDMTRFLPARAYNRRLGYYLMDAASVLPVLALSVEPSDVVLDLCAAPGGKTVLMMQSLDLSKGHLHCNELSRSRLLRLKEVLNFYFPRDITEAIEVSQLDGRALQEPVYNKVLVDVPCNADRHVLMEEDNNLFHPTRTRERLDLMGLQTKLLLSAIKSCVVGGEIVYSTCTLAPAQNDGVIQAAVEELVETSQIRVAVQDLSEFAQLFQDQFNFFERSRYGQTVLPDLQNNSGPTYFAKLKRLK